MSTGVITPSAARAGRTRSRPALALLALAALAAVAAVLSLGVGSNLLSPAEVWHGLTAGGFGSAGGGSGSADEAVAIVRQSRLPRTLLGAIVGLALGAAGALAQGHTRNPLADPGLLGVAAGAALAVAVGVYAFSVTDPGVTVWFGIAGALAASVAVFLVAASGGNAVSPVPLALAGAAVSALLATITSMIVLNDQATLDVYRRWAVGSLSGRGAEVVADVLPFAAVGLVLALVNTRALNALGLGEDVARGLGHRVLPARVAGLAAVVLLTGAATAAAGPIAFVGLAVPHVARALTGPDQRWLVPAAALAGADLLLLADVAGRVMGGRSEVPVGVVLALVGAPVFVAVARRRALAAL